jgi:hypothetical protein
MNPKIHELTFDGGMLERGFWLYIWEITAPDNSMHYYIGRTGDNSSPNAQSPFNRMGQHLGFNKLQNMLRQHLENHGIATNKCSFRLVSFGPILKEAVSPDEHSEPRNIIAALEKALAESMNKAGYDVLNTVKSRKHLDKVLWIKVRKSFAIRFPKLNGVAN